MTSKSNGSDQDRRPRVPARQAALTLLVPRLLSSAELQERLARRGYDQEDVADAMALVQSYGYLDDAALARAVRLEAERTCRGPLWVRRTLERRKVNETLCNAAQDEAENTARVCAQRFLTTKFGNAGDLQGKQRAKAQQQLLSRGFSLECVLDILDETG